MAEVPDNEISWFTFVHATVYEISFFLLLAPYYVSELS